MSTAVFDFDSAARPNGGREVSRSRGLAVCEVLGFGGNDDRCGFDFDSAARPRNHATPRPHPRPRNRETAEPRYHAISLPARTFTGDFWFTHAEGDRLWFALGDVAGKGLPAAIVMAMIQEELEHRVTSCATAGCDPATTMKRLDGFLKPLLPSNRFATAVIGWLDDDGGVTLVNAGHCPPMIVHADGSIEQIDSTGPVVGIVPNARWCSTTLTLDPGDLIVLYSDGVIESPSLDGNDFGVEGIVRALPRSTCARTVAASIVDSATRHAGGGSRYDDLTVMVIGAMVR
ncbi:MAG: phosphoserine phosphatase RsbU/P [Thermoanaerobaculia bacterium]|nr:phosphoserine phosphatase RsbU/P [Thermoanaerobaculia bacterium]